MTMQDVVLATKNEGKVREMRQALSELPIRIHALTEYDVSGDPIEDADTFLGNARIKARYYGSRLGLPVIADDSGLSVDALGGAPGVYSARFAGESATDEENNKKLREKLSELTEGSSPASYHCVLVFRDADGRELTATGSIAGEVRTQGKGHEGFGYDPYFYLPDGRTFAEYTVKEKEEISHRGVAMRELSKKLKEYWS